MGISRLGEGGETGPIDCDTRLVADDPGIVAGRDEGDFAGVDVRIAMRRDDFQRARELFLQGLELRRAAGHAWTEAISLASLAELSAKAGDEAGARPYGEEALAWFQRLGDAQRSEWVAGTLDSLGEGRRSSGQAANHRLP
jgi:hypothetical protein